MTCSVDSYGPYLSGLPMEIPVSVFESDLALDWNEVYE